MTSKPSSPNPFAEEPSDSVATPLEGTPSSLNTVRDAYNIVSDTATGLNVRRSDNWFQIKVIFFCVLLGIPSGAIVGAWLSNQGERLNGAGLGAIAFGILGIIVGTFGSGIYLMIYRAIRHFSGKHD